LKNASLFIPNSEIDERLLKEKILWFAAKVLTKEDSDIMIKHLSKLENIKSGRLEIPHDMYS
jgi:hypothetical protein